MNYLDTSVLVSALTEEVETARIQAWLHDRAPGELAISLWVATEFSSALSLKLRKGDIDKALQERALVAFRRFSSEVFEILPVTGPDLLRAAELANRHELNLRGGDALHLAVASAQGALLCTLDRRLAKVGAQLGLATRLL